MPCAAQKHFTAKPSAPQYPSGLMDNENAANDRVDEEAVLRATAIVRKYLASYQKETC